MYELTFIGARRQFGGKRKLEKFLEELSDRYGIGIVPKEDDNHLNLSFEFPFGKAGLDSYVLAEIDVMVRFMKNDLAMVHENETIGTGRRTISFRIVGC